MKPSALLLKSIALLILFFSVGLGLYLKKTRNDLKAFFPGVSHRNELGILALEGFISPKAVQSMQNILKVNINLKVVADEASLEAELAKPYTQFDLVQVAGSGADLEKIFATIPLQRLSSLTSISEDLRSTLFKVDAPHTIPVHWGIYFLPEFKTAPNAKTSPLLFYGFKSHLRAVANMLPKEVKLEFGALNPPKDSALPNIRIHRSNSLPESSVASALLFGVEFGIRTDSPHRELALRALNLLLDEEIALKNAQTNMLGTFHKSSEFQPLEAFQKPSYLRQISLIKLKALKNP